MAFTTITALALLAGAASAAVVPTAPGPGQSFNAGTTCSIQWTPDTTGTWKNFSLDLMTGSNLAMTRVAHVADLDGTASPGTYSWTCPEVNPYSAIYFYQFSLGGLEPTWTTRFTIASPSGATTPPANARQPDGSAIPWGTGVLVGGASNSTALSTAAVSSSISSSASIASASSSANSSSSSSTSSASMSTSVRVIVATASASSSSSSSVAAASNSPSTPAKAGAAAPAGRLGGQVAVAALFGAAGVVVFGLVSFA